MHGLLVVGLPIVGDRLRDLAREASVGYATNLHHEEPSDLVIVDHRAIMPRTTGAEFRWRRCYFTARYAGSTIARAASNRVLLRY